jgi:N-formylglutamate deformylase
MRHKPLAIIHVPHSSMIVPPDVRNSFILSDDELHAELLRITDVFTDELFDCNHHLAGRIIYPVSRLVADVERFANDEDEPMSKAGMGAVYTRTSRGNLLRKGLSAEDRQSLMKKYYEPHHKRLTAIVKDALTVYGHCLIIDSHSFSSLPLEYETDQNPDRPDICIGVDSYHTPKHLSEMVVASFEQAGFLVKENTPFAGTIVPMAYYHVNENVYSIMIEVNRSSYMDESTGKRNGQFTRIHNRLQPILRELIDGVFQEGRPGSHPDRSQADEPVSQTRHRQPGP